MKRRCAVKFLKGVSPLVVAEIGCYSLYILHTYSIEINASFHLSMTFDAQS